MLHISKITKTYGIQTILDNISFVVNRGERVGLIGPNGCGKTTLLRIITNIEQADAGHVRLDPSATMGYLPQGIDLETHQTLGAYIRAGMQEIENARTQAEHLAAQMTSDSSPHLIEKYGEALARFESLGGYDVEHRITTILAGLGLNEVAPDMPLDKLSGGQRTRVGLARLLLSQPSLLVLDEPTNHLDIAALEWLEKFIATYDGASLIVSHDWTFLDATVTRILELDETTHRITEYPGNYSDYVAAKEREREKQWIAWQDQQNEIADLKNAARHLRGIAQFRKGGKADTGDKFAKGFFANRSLETVRRAKQIERRIEHLMGDDHIDKPKQKWSMKLEFGEPLRSGQIVLALEDVGVAFPETRNQVSRRNLVSETRFLFRHANLTLRHGERIALVGANGTGKTTLLRIITGELSPTEGTVHIGANVRIGYMPQEQETLDSDATPYSTVRQIASMDETQTRHFLHFFLFEGDEVFTPVHSLSYGERARLLLARLVVSGVNCLLLDEPINHLDIPSRERFIDALDAFPGTVLVATHDRAFIDRFASGIWSPCDGTIRQFLDRAEMSAVIASEAKNLPSQISRRSAPRNDA
jgi:ATP-binding cassette subfamily F protein 3